jgi:hypothetical protein
VGTTQEFFELVYQADTAPVKAMDAALAEQHDALNLVGRDVYELAAGQVGLTRAFAATDVQLVEMKPALTAFDRELMASVEATQRANAVQRAMADNVGALGPAAGKATAGTKDLGRGILEVSRGLEDMQYGIAGVLNNIPQAVLAFGGPAGLAGVISMAAVAAKVLYDHWGEISNLFNSQNPIPAATDTLKKHEDALKKVNDELETFKGRTSLSNTELLHYNDLTAKSIDLEMKLADEREAEANRKAHGALSNAAARERAGAFGEAVDEFGGMPKLVEDILARSTQGATPKEIATFKTYLDNLIGEALKGDRAAIHEIGVVGRGTGIEGMLSATDPAAKRAEERFIEKQKKDTKDTKERDGKAIEEANRAEAASIAEAGRQAHEEAVASGKAARVDARIAAQGAKKDLTGDIRDANKVAGDLGREAKTLGATGLADQAGMMVAQLMGQGKTQQQAENATVEQLRGLLQKNGMNFLKAGGLATSIVNEVGKTLEAQLAANNAVGQNQAALLNRQQVLQGYILKQARELQQIRQRADAMGQTALNQGGPT